MIKFSRLVPEIYMKQSRDYQMLGHIFDAILNSGKLNVDVMDGLPLSKNSDKKLLDLTMRMLGFESKHIYNEDDLYALANSFSAIMRKKGTVSAIEDAVKVLLRAQNVVGEFAVRVVPNECVVSITLPVEVKDLVLLEDLFDYILPAGYNYTLSSVSDYVDEGEIMNVKETYRVGKNRLGKIHKPDKFSYTEDELTSIEYDEEGKQSGVNDRGVQIEQVVVNPLLDINNNKEAKVSPTNEKGLKTK